MTNHENHLIVENALDDDNSVVRLSSKMMDKLQFFCGDAVKLKGRKRRQTVCIALSDDSCSDDHIKMNSVIQKNLRVHAGNTITIQEYPRAIYGTRIHVLPFNDTLCDIAEDVLNENLKSYFCDAFRPVYIGNTFSIRIGTDKVEFKVMQTDPSPCCIVAPETVIDCKGEPIHYIEEQYLNNEVDFYDIGGYKDIKKSLQESVQGILKYQNTEYYFKYGLLPSTGILLYGPPGCGKTMLAKALANECDMNLLIIKGPELVCAWGNDPETNLRATFDKARQSAPCILLIDELDYVFENESMDRLINQLLTEIDGLNVKTQVILIAATNRPELFYQTFLRPGRFDELVYVPLPDEDSREAILNITLQRCHIAADVDMKSLSRMQQGASGADIVEFCRTVCRAAIREAIEKESQMEQLDADIDLNIEIRQDHFEQALKTSSRLRTIHYDIRKYEVFARTWQSSHTYNFLFPTSSEAHINSEGSGKPVSNVYVDDDDLYG